MRRREGTRGATGRRGTRCGVLILNTLRPARIQLNSDKTNLTQKIRKRNLQGDCNPLEPRQKHRLDNRHR